MILVFLVGVCVVFECSFVFFVEVMATWGTVEAKRLGLFELLRERCAIEVRYLTYHVDGVGAPIDLLAAAPHFEPACVSSPSDAAGSDRGGCSRGGDGMASVEIGNADGR